MQSVKELVLRRFLEFVGHYIPLQDASFATLGGQGIEAKLWAEAGVPFEKGNLIELNGLRSRSLIKNHRYRVHNRLGTFHKVLGGYGEDSIDAFHLDLCGTVGTEVLNDFAPILPLIVKSEGRFLAITVADARRNVALEQWDSIIKDARKKFRGHAMTTFDSLLEQQRMLPVRADLPTIFKAFDPEKAAKREFALMLSLFLELKKLRGSWYPGDMSRYVYVSRYGSTRGFRMRTYMMKLTPGPKTADQFTRSWLKSPLYFSNNGEFVKISGIVPPTVEVKPEGETSLHTSLKSPLAQLVDRLGGEEKAEYDELLAKGSRLDTLVDGLRKAGIMPLLAEAFASSPTSTSASSQSNKPARKKWEDLSDAEQLEWLIGTLELKGRSNGKWDNGGWDEHLKSSFGYYNITLGKTLRSALAHTGMKGQGKFRAQFIKRIKHVFGPEGSRPYLARYEALLK